MIDCTSTALLSSPRRAEGARAAEPRAPRGSVSSGLEAPAPGDVRPITGRESEYRKAEYPITGRESDYRQRIRSIHSQDPSEWILRILGRGQSIRLQAENPNTGFLIRTPSCAVRIQKLDARQSTCRLGDSQDRCRSGDRVRQVDPSRSPQDTGHGGSLRVPLSLRHGLLGLTTS
jgi:hypothetical protein